MALSVSAEPMEAVADAMRTRLAADVTLMTTPPSGVTALSGVYGRMPESSRTAYPFVVVGDRSLRGDGFAMQRHGGEVSVQLDVFSAAKGSHETHAILSRISTLLSRYPLRVVGFTPMDGSLRRELSDVTYEPDADAPERALYHGVQRWEIDVEDSL